MSSRSRALALFAVPLAFSFALTSCQDGNDPAATTPPSESPATSSPTASPSPTKSQPPKPVPASAEGPAKNIPVPDKPEKAHNRSDEGAAAFTAYYFDIVNYALESYKADTLAEISSRSCYLCGDFLIDPIRRNASRGNWQVGGKYKVRDFVAHKTGKSDYTVSFIITRERKQMYASTGELVEDSPAISNPIAGAAKLKYGEQWVVESLVFEKQE